LNYKEHIDFELIEGELVNLNEKNRNEMMNTSSGKHIVRINVFREHRQTIQYILPTDVSYARQSEILIIDEAAAIPLPLVKNLMGPYTVILSSTINGYEGTGRGLSLKLINSLKQSSQMKSSTRLVKELDLKAPIRYAPNDPIENWLNRLLCLDATTPTPLQYSKTLPLPSDCQLYEVNRDALFSYHKESEKFLHNLLSLFISSHYKSSPNDLILLSDAPSHHIFILLPKITNESSEIPDILVAIHVAIEGSINKDVIRNNLMSGIRPSGDLIPWTLSQNFIDEDFGALNGVRIMRIATHASIQRLGYGTEALRQLCDFFENSSSNNSNLLEINENINARLNINFNNNINPESITSSKNGTADGDVLRLSKTTYNSALKSEVTTPNDLSTTDNDKNNDTNDSVSTIDTVEIPALLELCKDRSFSVQVDYIGVSFGLTLDLFKFYNRLNFYSVYIRSKTSNVTGENTVIMLRCKADWISNFVEDFKRRTASILGSSLKHFPCDLSLSLLAPSYLFNQHLSAKRDLPFISHENVRRL
jgi:N-acetyltransferase 10